LQQTLSRLKLLHRTRIRHQVAEKRQSVSVHFKNVFWVQDGTKHQGSSYQVIKDRGSLKVLSVKINKRETGQEIIGQLQCAKASRGLPLVLGTDNGSMYTCKKVGEFLTANKIIHLRSLPRTPQHNGAMECAIREIKDVATLGEYSLEYAANQLNRNRLRAKFRFKSSEKMDDQMIAGYDEQTRASFFEHCQSKLKNVQAVVKNKRSRRMAERSIVFEALQQFGFIELNRGGLV